MTLAAGAARADEFEKKAAGASHLRHLDDITWALSAPCDQGDDTQQRECRHVRDARAKELAGTVALVDADPALFEIGAWSAAKKSLSLHVGGGDFRAAPLLDNAKGFADEAAATAWAATAKGARVQVLVRVPAKWNGKARGAAALGVEVLGWRVYAPCSGAILSASPASGAVEGDPGACPKPEKKVRPPSTIQDLK